VLSSGACRGLAHGLRFRGAEQPAGGAAAGGADGDDDPGGQQQAGLENVPPLAELSSTTAIKAAVAAGAGPALLSSLAVEGELSAGTLREVTITGLNLDRTLLAVWAASRRLAGPARDLYAIATRSARRARGPG
jgi:DNA-binding transcriptional LysR family regulator